MQLYDTLFAGSHSRCKRLVHAVSLPRAASNNPLPSEGAPHLVTFPGPFSFCRTSKGATMTGLKPFSLRHPPPRGLAQGGANSGPWLSVKHGWPGGHVNANRGFRYFILLCCFQRGGGGIQRVLGCSQFMANSSGMKSSVAAWGTRRLPGGSPTQQGPSWNPSSI